MENPTSYEQIIQDAPLAERQVVAIESIAESLALLAAERRYAHLADLLGSLGVSPTLPVEECPELAQRRQAAAGALFATRSKITGLSCPFA